MCALLLKLLRAALPALLFCCTESAAQNLRRISYVIDSVLSHQTVSANILIASDSRIIFEKSVGFSSITTARPLQHSNAFQVASLSKQFTAYGILLLQHKKMLGIDSTVQRYLPEFPYPGITIRHLLTHTSGLPSFSAVLQPKLDTSRCNTNKELLALLAGEKPALQSAPGSTFEYTDIGYHLLACIIERVSGKSYHQFMRQYVFRPSRMYTTSAEQVTDIRNIKNIHLATGHIYDTVQQTYVPAHLHPAHHAVFYLGGLYGSGSVVTTVFDLFLWHRVLSRGLLLPAELQREAFEPYRVNGQLPRTRNGLEAAYGFGWVIGEDEVMGKVLSHGGAHPGFTSYYYRFPDRQLCFVFLSNAETPANNYLRSRILSLLKE